MTEQLSLLRIRCNLLRAIPIGPSGWLDLIRATLELAVARYQNASRSPPELLLSEQCKANPRLSVRTTGELARIVDRVAFAVPRMGARVPWRADCFVQARAARRWLSREGIATELFLGVRDDPSQGLQFHAWLKLGDRIVTGGDISGFVPLESDCGPIE